MSNILLIAAPGAGKGVVSKYLVDKYNYVHLSVGNLIRKEATKNESLSNVLSKGKLVSDELVYKLFSEFLDNNNGDKFVFDGFPRTMNQISNFETILSNHNLKVDKVIIIDIDKDIAIKRITGRRTCENCNHIFNKYIDNVSDVCPDCGGKLFTRNDDNVDTYIERYNLFINETMPIIEYFKEKYNYFEIENDSTLENVYKQIDYIIKEDDVNDNN